jgi:Protein of unknown function (DUF3099)
MTFIVPKDGSVRNRTDYQGTEVWNSGDMKHGQELSFDDDGQPVLITRAAQPYEEQHRARVRKYLTIMSFRVPALLLAALAYGIWHNGLVSLAILVASIPLPWIAVLIANDRPPRRAEEPRRYTAPRRIPLFPTAERPALGSRSPASPQPESTESPYDVP